MWPAIQSFRLRDAIDILLVAIVLYRVFVMFKETRAVQMLLGLGALMAASFFANRFELYGTSWILDNFWSFWVLALIVLFQPELRRALAQFGQNPFFRAMTRAGREQQSHLLDEVVKAAESWPPSASAGSSCSNGRRGSATTPSWECLSMPSCRLISSRASSSPIRLCTTAPCSSAPDAWPRRAASCPFPVAPSSDGRWARATGRPSV
jgi:Uncharacterized conserved protein